MRCLRKIYHGKFTNVEIKWPGSVRDAREFANCKVQESFTSGNFKLFYKELLPGRECVPQLLLRDPAYSLLSYVMKEHEHCSGNEEVIFNQMPKSARNMISFKGTVENFVTSNGHPS